MSLTSSIRLERKGACSPRIPSAWRAGAICMRMRGMTRSVFAIHSDSTPFGTAGRPSSCLETTASFDGAGGPTQVGPVAWPRTRTRLGSGPFLRGHTHSILRRSRTARASADGFAISLEIGEATEHRWSQRQAPIHVGEIGSFSMAERHLALPAALMYASWRRSSFRCSRNMRGR